VGGGGEDDGFVGLTLSEDDLHGLFGSEGVLYPLGQGFVLLGALLLDLLGVRVRVREGTIFLGEVDELLVSEVSDVGDDVLIDGVSHEEDFDVALDGIFEDGGLLDLVHGLSGEEVDGLLGFGHAFDVVFEGDVLVLRLGGLVTEELGEASTVGAVFDHTEAEVLAELFPELGEEHVLLLLATSRVVLVIFGLLFGVTRVFTTFFLLSLLLLDGLVILSDFLEHTESLADELALDDLEDAVFLKDFTGDVQGEIVGVNNTLDEVQVAGEEVLEFVSDEDSADVEADVGGEGGGVEGVVVRAAVSKVL